MSEQTKTAQTTTTTETTETAKPTMTLETVIDAILDSLNFQDYTGYRIAQVINAAYAILEMDRKAIEPQRMYGAAKSGQINGVKAVKGSEQRYSRDEVKAFAIRWIEKSHATNGTTNRVEMKSLIAAAASKLSK